MERRSIFEMNAQDFQDYKEINENVVIYVDFPAESEDPRDKPGISKSQQTALKQLALKSGGKKISYKKVRDRDSFSFSATFSDISTAEKFEHAVGKMKLDSEYETEIDEGNLGLAIQDQKQQEVEKIVWNVSKDANAMAKNAATISRDISKYQGGMSLREVKDMKSRAMSVSAKLATAHQELIDLALQLRKIK